MLNKVKQYISKNHLLDKEKHYLVALSGGADSVSLLLILCELGYKVHAVHCNFRLRGEESDRDERFCIELCKRLGMPFHLAHFDTRAYASRHKVSIEMAARNLRYDYFERLRQDISAAGICVGHHEEDSVETVLLNLTRGTGLKGLIGIRPRNGYILRPLLCLSRDEIEDYLHRKGETYITDSSNLVDDVTRNKFRLNIIPQLQALNPSFNNAIGQMSAYLGQVEQVVSGAVAAHFAAHGISIGALPRLQEFELATQIITDFYSPEYLLFSVLSPLGFNAAQISEINDALPAGQGRLWRAEKHEVTLSQTALIVREIPTCEAVNKRFPEPGLYVIDAETKLRLSIINEPQSVSMAEMKRNPMSVYLDADKLSFPLTLRTPREGDRFCPFGMKGSKLISDFLTDRKMNRFQKERQLLLVDSTGKIGWVVGLRTAEACRITPETKRILNVTMIKSEANEEGI